MSTENARKIVRERGAPLLDSIRPGWFREVDVEELASGGIIEHLYGDYFGTISEIGLEYPPMDYGFDIGIANAEELSQAWREVVTAKLSSTLPPVFD